VTDTISAVVLRGTPRWWFAAFGEPSSWSCSSSARSPPVLKGSDLRRQHPGRWGWDITNFVWWIGSATPAL